MKANLKVFTQDGALVGQPPTPKGEYIGGLSTNLLLNKNEIFYNILKRYPPFGVGGTMASVRCAKTPFRRSVLPRWYKSLTFTHHSCVFSDAQVMRKSSEKHVRDVQIMGTSQRLVPAFHRWAAIIFILMLAVFASSTQLLAQPLDSLIQIALRQNPGLKASYTRYQSQLERAPQQSQLADPRLDFSTQFLPLRMRTWEQAAIIGGMQEFPWPGTLTARSSLALSEARVSYKQAEVEALNLKYEVQIAWLEYYQFIQSIGILEEGLTLSKSAERLAQAKLESGRGSASDLLKIELKIRQQEQQVDVLKNRLHLPQHRLNQLLNQPVYTPIEIEQKIEFELQLFDVDSLLKEIMRYHPGVSSLRYQQEASRQMETLNRLEGKPDIGIGLDYVVMSKITEHGITSDGKDMLMPRIGIRLPLYRKKYEAKAQEENLRRKSLDLEAEALENDFGAELGHALSLQEEARLTHEFVAEQLKTLEALINMQEGNFSTNADVYESLLENYQLRLDYQLMDLQAIVQTWQAKFAIQKLITR